MRLLFFSLCLLSVAYIHGQDLISYKDTLYKFSIGIPVGWRYGKPKTYPHLLLISIRQPVDTTEKMVETFNVNAVQEPNSNLDTAFSHLLKYNSIADSFTVLEKGSTTINLKDFRWVVSTHRNKYNGQEVYNYDFMTYDDSKAYILTMTSTPKNFERVRPLFDKIAQSFQVREIN